MTLEKKNICDKFFVCIDVFHISRRDHKQYIISQVLQSDWTGCNWEGGLLPGYYRVTGQDVWAGGLLPGYYRVTGQDVIESEGYYQVITAWLDRMSLRGRVITRLLQLDRMSLRVRVITRLLQSDWTGCLWEGGLLPGYYRVTGQDVFEREGYYQVITEWLDRLSLRGRVITRLLQSDWKGCLWEWGLLPGYYRVTGQDVFEREGYYQVITEWLDRMSLRGRVITRLLQSDWTGCHWGGGLLPGYYRVIGQDVIESEGYYQVITEWLDRMSLRVRVITRLLQSDWTGCLWEGGLLPGYYRVTGQAVFEREGYYQVITEWLDRMSLRVRLLIIQLIQSLLHPVLFLFRRNIICRRVAGLTSVRRCVHIESTANKIYFQNSESYQE